MPFYLICFPPITVVDEFPECQTGAFGGKKSIFLTDNICPLLSNFLDFAVPVLSFKKICYMTSLSQEKTSRGAEVRGKGTDFSGDGVSYLQFQLMGQVLGSLLKMLSCLLDVLVNSKATKFSLVPAALRDNWQI